MNEWIESPRGSFSAVSKPIFASKYYSTRVKALDEIYKIYRLLHRSDLQMSAKKPSDFFKIDIHCLKLESSRNFPPANVAISTLNLDDCFIYRNFATLLRKCKIK